MDDAAASRACRAGHVDACRHFVDRYQGRALAHARLLTRNEADAAQDAFLDAFRALAAFDASRPLRLVLRAAAQPLLQATSQAENAVNSHPPSAVDRRTDLGTRLATNGQSAGASMVVGRRKAIESPTNLVARPMASIVLGAI